MNGIKIQIKVQDTFGKIITADYAKIGDITVVEMAQVAVLSLVEERLNLASASTYGVG